jgi:L-amino acid N-acyltransferase YncA
MHLDLNKQASIVMEIHDKAKETHDQTRETTTVGLEEMRTLLDIEKT